MYKVGDEVLVKAKIKDMSHVDMMYVCELVTNPDVCIRFKSPTECIVPDKTYEMGLTDAWELAKKIVLSEKEGGFSYEQLGEIFGVGDCRFPMNTFTAEEALAKIEAYEKEKEIKVGDVVEHNGFKGVVVHILPDGELNIVYENGLFGASCSAKEYVKTGKHLEIADLLRQIGE